jgi:hypothetical protein
MVSMPGRIIGRCVVPALTVIALTGCATNWHDAHKTYATPYEQGQFATASEEVTRIAKSISTQDKVLVDLEAGAILRAAGKISESNASLDDADKMIGDYSQWPTVKITEEAVAALTTVRTIYYRGTLCDLVMLNVYRALNHMELGNADGARTYLIRASFVQQDIADKYAAELRKEQAKLDQEKVDPQGQYDVNKTLTAKDAQGQSLDQRLKHDTYKDLYNLQPYADYINPFCDYMSGVYFLGAALDPSDRERAATSFKRTASMVKANPFVLEDVQEAERVANGATVTPTTYVIFETGVAPEMDQVQIPLPLFIFSNQAPTVVLYFPVMKPRAGCAPFCRVTTSGGGSYQTVVVSDMDSVIEQEFKNQLPTLITRMLIGAATKAAIDAAVKQGLKNESDFAQIAFSIASTVYQTAMNQADLRLWESLPKQFQVARFPTPDDRTVTLNVLDNTPAIKVKLASGSGRINVVWVKSVRAGIPAVVRQFVIGPNGTPPPAPPTTNMATIN